MAAAAPEGVDEPRVVILTPGPLSETYFEHAYLASYLGYALVEGRDLVVNNNRVWLRSLAGFDPVDVVIRRVDDAWCDPVELRADSLLGVPGLLEVARRGRVTVLNPLGLGDHRDPGADRPPRVDWPRCSSARTWPSGARRPGGAADPAASATCWPTSTTSWSCRCRPHRPGRARSWPPRCPPRALSRLRDRIRARPGDWVGPGDHRALHRPDA